MKIGCEVLLLWFLGCLFSSELLFACCTSLSPALRNKAAHSVSLKELDLENKILQADHCCIRFAEEKCVQHRRVPPRFFLVALPSPAAQRSRPRHRASAVTTLARSRHRYFQFLFAFFPCQG